MRILISGSNGFIGKALISVATDMGHELIGLSRTSPLSKNNVHHIEWRFGDSLPDIKNIKIDMAIHLAHDFNGEIGANKTIEATHELACFLNRIGVSRQIYISSYSAGPYATSLYAKTKLKLESILRDVDGLVIVRPGLVLGNGGIYGRMKKWAQMFPIVPLPALEGKVPVIEIKKLCLELIRISDSSMTYKEVNIFEPTLVSLKKLIIDAAYEVGKKPLIISIPITPLILILKFAEFLRIPLPIGSDNLAGFVANQASNHISIYEGAK